MVAKDPTPNSSTFDQLNAELNDFYKYLKENKFSDEDIEKIFEPLRAKLRRRELVKYSALITLSVTIFVLGCIHYENVSWYTFALARIILIEIQPYWNWQKLKNDYCLVYHFGITGSLPPDEFLFNCDICETIDAVDVLATIDSDALKIRYIDMDTPVILTESQFGWPRGSELVGNISSNKDLRSSYPCNMAANIINGDTNVGKLLDKTDIFASFFLHFRNCETQAVKNFRLFIGRPQYLHPELAPIQFSWFLWSRDYNVSNYKELDLIDTVAVVGQIEGSNYFELMPRLNCEGQCNTLHVKLEKGEALIVTSLWNLHYRPYEKGDNVAVILETR